MFSLIQFKHLSLVDYVQLFASVTLQYKPDHFRWDRPHLRHRVGMYAEMWSDDARAGIAEQTPGPGLVYCFLSCRFLQYFKFSYVLELYRIKKLSTFFASRMAMAIF